MIPSPIYAYLQTGRLKNMQKRAECGSVSRDSSTLRIPIRFRRVILKNMNSNRQQNGAKIIFTSSKNIIFPIKKNGCEAVFDTTFVESL